MALVGTASIVTTFLSAQADELSCDAAPEFVCLQTEVYRHIERQFLVFPKMLDLSGQQRAVSWGVFYIWHVGGHLGEGKEVHQPS